jgi:hypothetical protein
MYSPIYYDSNNTAYLINGDSQSRLNTLLLDGELKASNGNGRIAMYGNFHMDAYNGNDIYLSYYNTGRFRVFNGTPTESFRVDNDRIVYSYFQFRTPLIYDLDNTGFYLDPSSNSNLNTGTFTGRLKFSNYIVSTNESGMMGSYNSTSTADKVIWTIGESWPLANMYGLAYQYNGEYGHHLSLKENGTTYHRISFGGQGALFTGNVQAQSSLRAPIFYDSNNTAYYLDPASTSRLNGIAFNGGSALYSVTAGTSYTSHIQIKETNQAGAQGQDIIYAPSLAFHWGGVVASNITMEASGRISIRNNPGTGYENFVARNIYATIYYDDNNTGYYLDPASTSNLNGLTVNGTITGNINGNAQRANHLNTTRDAPDNSLQYWQASGLGITEAPSGDWHNTIRLGHGNAVSYYSNTLAIRMTGSGQGDIYTQTIANGTALGWKKHWNDGGAINSNYEIYAPIFYDVNNTGFYVNPDSTSRLNVSVTNTSYFGADTNKGYAEGYGTWSTSLRKIAYISFDWNANQNNYSNHGIATTDINGNFNDNISINSYNDINLRLDTNDNNGNSYVRIHDNGAGNSQNVAYIGREDGSAIAYFYNRVYGSIFYDINNTGYYLDPNGTSRINRTNYDFVYSYNWIYAQGDVIAYYSDERLKTKVGSIENALDKISKLNGFYYVENDLAKSFGYKNEKRQLGLSAQEVKAVLPEIVTLAPFDTETDENNNIVGSKSGEDYLTVNYAKVVPLLVEGIKEQTEIIKSQQKQIDELKEMIQKLMK